MSIPPLLPKNGQKVGCSEGPTIFKRFVRPVGLVRAVTIFVDFPDAPADETPLEAARKRLGEKDEQGRWGVEGFYADQSFGRLNLRVEVKDDLGWRRMARLSTDYGDPAANHHFTSHAQHVKYIEDVAKLFSPAEVKAGTFDMVFIVAPKGAAFPFSPAFPAPPGQGARAPGGGEILAAVTFGKDSATNSFINLVHEMGHLFGLPDLYTPGEGAETSKAGCWSVMSDIFRARDFLGWHRHKNGWLPEERKEYVSQPTRQTFTLTPLSAGTGTAMVVFPVDNPARPSQVFVLEVAPTSASLSGKPVEEGVLLYLVDGNVDTDDTTRDPKKPPLAILPRVDDHDPDCGNLFQAAYRVGDESVVHQLGDASLSLKVLAKNAASYDVEVDYRRG